ncbi:MAG: hypothetical protein ACYSTS_08200 [Planctomycetota bacterium]|jgi:hypothetical protein
MEWLFTLPVQAQAAIIGACVTLIGIFLRDLLFKLLQEYREERKSAIEIFRKYADPLTSSATSLLWRFHEIFYHKERSVYLKEPRTEFENYKKISTTYRLASILGWIRAYRRELSFLQAKNKKQLITIEESINSIERALADGPHIEQKRLEGLIVLWKLNAQLSNCSRPRLAIIINNIIKPFLHDAKVELASKLPSQQQYQLCNQIAEILCDELKMNHLSDQVINETKARAIQELSIKESWLYRDWQEGIGDLMIMEIDHSSRKFAVVGFKEFENFLLSGTDEQKRWIDRLNNIFINLDVSGADIYDARVQQLRNTMVAIAKLVKALAKVKTRQHIVSKETISIADNILNN